MNSLADVGLLLLGGFISLLASLFSFYVSHRVERKRQDGEEHQAAAVQAFVASQKLLNTLNFIHNVNKYVKECYDEADAHNQHGREPGLILKPPAGMPYQFEMISSQEVLFLARQGKGPLISDIIEIQMRAKGVGELLAEFKRLRHEYDDFIDRTVAPVKEVRSDAIVKELTGHEAVRAHSKLGALNTVVAGLLEQLETIESNAEDTLARLIDAARGEFGSLFPLSSIEKVRSNP